MNSSIYIFGELFSGYTQYPEDSSSDIFKRLYKRCKAPTQIVICRDEDMMYYCYIKKLDGNKYIGLSFAVNGYYLSKINLLFSLFENAIEIMAQQGVFIHFKDNGSLTTSLRALKLEDEEVNFLVNKLRTSFENIIGQKKLPIIDYTIAKDSVKEFCISDNNLDIIKSSYTYGFTYIYKDKDFDTVRVNSYKSILNRISEENTILKKQNNDLQKQYKNILQEKNQYRYITIAVFIILCCGVGLFFLYDNLNSTKGQLVDAENTIVNKNNVINRLNTSRDSFKLCLINEKQEKRELEKNLSAICTSVPFVITSCSINAEEVVVDYYAAEQKDVTIYLKAINESEPEIVSNSHSVTIYKGNNKLKLSFNYRLNPANYYYVNVLYDGHVIGGKRW